jgi:hypothetical protein
LSATRIRSRTANASIRSPPQVAAAEPVHHGGGVGGPGAGQHGQPAGHDDHPGLRVPQHGLFFGTLPARRRVHRQPQEAHHPATGDQGPADVEAALDEEGDRHDKHGRVPPDRDEFAHRDLAGGGHPRGQPGDHGQEQRGQADAERLDPAGHRADPVALLGDTLGVAAVAAGVGLLATEAVEDPQPADDVDEPVGERALVVAVAGAGALQPAQHRPHHDGQHRHPGEHHDGQQRRDLQQQRGHDDVGDDRAEPGPGHGQGLGEHPDVGDADGDDLPRADPPRQRGTEAGGVRDDRSHGAETAVQPDLRHGPVPQDGQNRVDHADHEEHGHPGGQRRQVAPLQPAVDGLRQQVRRERQPDHPQRPEQRAGGDPQLLPPHEPPQVRQRTTHVGNRVSRFRHALHLRAAAIIGGSPNSGYLRGRVSLRA